MPLSMDLIRGRVVEAVVEGSRAPIPLSLLLPPGSPPPPPVARFGPFDSEPFGSGRISVSCRGASGNPLADGLNRGWSTTAKPIGKAAPEMTDIADVSLRQAAVFAGLGYLIVFIFGFANIRREKLTVRGDAATTASNIVASESLANTTRNESVRVR